MRVLTGYATAIASIAVAILARQLLTPWLGTTFPLATMFTAVAFVVWRAGWGPALGTALGGWVAAGLLFRGGWQFFTNLTFNEVVGLGVYLLACGSVIVLGEAMRRAQRRLLAEQDQLSTTNLQLENKVEAQSLLAAIVASSQDAIVSKTLNGIITSWNKGAERLFGYTADEAIGQSIHLIVPPELRDQERDILERLRRGERIEHLDVERLRKDGARIQISVTISPVYDRHGHIIGASKTARDITLRKEWEDSLLRSEEAQRLLVDIHDATRGLHDPSMVTREILTRVGLHFDVTRCVFGEVDAGAAVMTLARGHARDVPSIAGRYPLDAFGPRLVAELTAGRTTIVDDTRTDPLTGSPLAQQTYAAMQIVSMVCAPLIRDGRLVAVLMMCDRKPRAWACHEATLLEQVAERTLFAVESARAAEALRDSRDVVAMAMTAGRMGAWTRDLVSDRAWWSPELAEILGIAATEGDADRSLLAELIHPDDRAAVARTVDEAIARREDYAAEFRFHHAPSGEWRWMEARGKATYGADGKPVMLFGLGIDITDRRRALEALQEADRRKDEFLATLAHELRNPLAPIASGLHILRAAEDKSEAAAAARGIMERQVGQMVRLVDDLLDVARITTGKIELQCEPINLADAIGDAIETSRPLITSRSQRFSTDFPPEPIYVNADRTRLAQVFANLLNNSSKYSEPEQEITIAVTREGGDAVVRIRDEGIGIHAEMLPRVFEMFRQSDRTGGRSRGGLGIGLSLVKRIVELHHGTVIAASAGLGRGSEFMVRLPAMATARAAVRKPEPASAAAPLRRRVLVVDDNEDAAESLAALLQINGHETRLAHDGPEAVEQARRFQPDVIFLDIGMPIVDGHETARRIRQQPWGKAMVLVALTGWGQVEDRRRSKEAGFNHHLVKPADPAVVTKLLSEIPLAS